jgi:hypothetical protein
MHPAIKKINESFNSVFSSEDLLPQYNVIKRDIVELACALQEKACNVDVVSTLAAVTVVHRFNGKQERKSFNCLVIDKSDLQEMREFRLFLGETLQLLKGEAA